VITLGENFEEEPHLSSPLANLIFVDSANSIGAEFGKGWR